MFISNAMAATAAFAQEAAETAEELAHDAADASNGVFPPFDSSTFASQLFWLAITFGFFYWFIANVATPRLGGILETRQDRIADDLDKARELTEEGEAAEAAYEQALAEARNTAGEIAAKARDKAKADAEAERQKTEAEVAEKLAEAEKRITEIRDKALAEVGSIAEDTTGAIVQELVGSKVTKAELDKAIAAVRS